jgi:protein SCO1/2
MLCTLVLNGAMTVLGALPFNAGKDYEFVAVSIDPSEGPELASAKQRAYVQHYGPRPRQTGVHFLTGPQSSISQLAGAVGFRYRYDRQTRQYAHPALITVLTPVRSHSRPQRLVSTLNNHMLLIYSVRRYTGKRARYRGGVR